MYREQWKINPSKDRKAEGTTFTHTYFYTWGEEYRKDKEEVG